MAGLAPNNPAQGGSQWGKSLVSLLPKQLAGSVATDEVEAALNAAFAAASGVPQRGLPPAPVVEVPPPPAPQQQPPPLKPALKKR